MIVDVADVAGLLEARGAGVAPDHEHGLVAGVLEPVVVVLRHEDDLAGAELHVGVADACDAVAGDEVLELLGVGCRWMSCFAPGGNTVMPKTECSAPTVSRVNSQRTSMSTQPSSARRAGSLGVASKLVFIGWSLTRRIVSDTSSPPGWVGRS